MIPGDWGAKWVSLSQHPEGDMGVFAFRRHVSLAAKPTQFSVKLSADQRYKLFVNGRFIGFGPQRGDLHHWFYDTYDVAPFLREGSNWIVVQVAYFGRYAPMAQHTARQGLAVHGDLLRGVHLGAQLAHRPAIDHHPAGRDQPLAVPPRADAGVGQKFVEAFHGGYFTESGPARQGSAGKPTGCRG